MSKYFENCLFCNGEEGHWTDDGEWTECGACDGMGGQWIQDEASDMTAHSGRGVHGNSLEAVDVAMFNARERLIVRYLQTQLTPLTDREIMAALGFGEPNSTRPRITSLIQKHVLAEGPNVKDATTGKTVRTTYVCARVQESLLV